MNYSPGDSKELDMTEQPTHTHTHTHRVCQRLVDKCYLLEGKKKQSKEGRKERRR